MKKLILCFLLIALVLITGCSILRDIKETATHNMLIEKELPKYELNMENFKEISYEGKTYEISETEVALSDLNKPVGKVSKSITINDDGEILTKNDLRKIEVIPNDNDEKRVYLNFGWVYSVNGIDQDKKVAVVINNKIYLSNIKK
ncbi:MULTISPECIES: NisI/SpaI family lantibiotic immunity lipoprotein [Pallidibacillus]|jgi:lantibiotic immunity protein|uniref:NisI/SpaI family lantibiotic immunity lipoprotein n=1 Tax=Pallidibacillus pasinlerensis TaxID=2703818 RepID=A0ABX0A672_9BACI|nr:MULTISPECIES: NisI/SpaI family lantibiotic immunity lipoprotein [Pallidibacillus]MED1674689.1 NisI/SpaI family lantibiotic immunity lipoprotein [Pallidibacillus thermolactis subsp. kokeshiiformis]NCU18920.1 NisI/SpaI family lantibiotic immunity lipoprotein [Pallidibacillus pasinlerensis]